jgi:hypothetical protein
MSLSARTYVVLLHHPVYNREGRVVTTAVTNLDIHDIARSSRTYGLAGYFIVTPVQLQRELVSEIVAHWMANDGKADQPRRQAMELVKVVPSLAAAVERIREDHGSEPLLAATAARPADNTVDWQHWRTECEAETRPVMLLFGTGWGLTEQVFDQAQIRLAPVWGPTSYNHLSVRSAVAIALDRLFGR